MGTGVMLKEYCKILKRDNIVSIEYKVQLKGHVVVFGSSIFIRSINKILYFSLDLSVPLLKTIKKIYKY